MKLISACLLGINCRYNGKSKLNKKAENLFVSGEAILICPEVLAKLGIPREACEIVGGDGFDVLEGRAKIISKSGKDMTSVYLEAAQDTFKIIEKFNIKNAYLKSGSPTCGAGKIYSGTFDGNKKTGLGIFSALLAREGIELEELD